MTNGEKLRAWREGVGLSQAKAARRIGTKQRTWGCWEAGATPEIDFAEAIEKLTGGAVAMRDWVRARRKRRREESTTDLAKVEADDEAPHARESA